MVAPLIGSLQDSPADVIAQILINMGLVADPDSSSSSNPDWLISVDQELAVPDDVIEIHNTAGIQSGRVQITGQMSELYGIQFMVRAVDSRIAFAMMNQLAVIVDQQIYRVTVPMNSGKSYFLDSITRTGTPIALGKEAPLTKRYIYTLNAITSVIQLN
jgi:hypothetical protein